MFKYPPTVIGTVLPLRAQFQDRNTQGILTMTGGSATVRVVSDAGAVVVDNVSCTISGKTVTYLWDTAGLPAGRYFIQFRGTPPSGTLFIEPADPATVVLVSEI